MRKLLQTTLLLLVIIFLANGSYAQSLIMDNSTNLKEVDRPVFIGKNDSVFFVKSITTEKNNDKAFVLKCFRHADMSIVYDKLILPPQINKLPTITENVLYLNDKLYLFTSQYDSKTKQNNLYVNTINADGTVNNDPKLIHTKSKEDKSNYLFIQSADKSKILVAYWGNNDETKFSFNCKVLDANLNLFWEQDIETKFGSKSTHRIILDNNGNMYFFTSFIIYKGKKIVNRSYSIFSYDCTKKNLNYFKINSDDMAIISKNLGITIDNHNNIVLVGLYSKLEGSNSNGFDIDKYDSSLSGFLIMSFNNTTFDDVKTKYFSFNPSYNITTLNHYCLIGLSISELGNIIITLELVYVVSELAGSDSYANYFLENVTIASFDLNTNLNWVKSIEKSQRHILKNFKDKGESYYTSFFPILDKENIKIVYKSDKKNIAIKNIDNKGNISSKEVNSTHFNIENPKAIIKDKGVNLTLKNSLKISENEIVTYNPEIKKFVKLILE